MVENQILEVKNLKKYYKLPKKHFFKKKLELIHAVDDISFSIIRGETFGIVGESGSGKSTVARLICKLITPTEGEINFYGKNILNQTKDETFQLRKDIQMVFQSPYGTLDGRKKIRYSLEEPFEIHKIADKQYRKNRIAELLDLTNLHISSLEKYPHEFSGGQLQRINIARAIALQPKFVICDESVSALDVSVQAQILNLLNDLKKELGLTYLFISHDLNVIRYFCDRIGVMKNGQLLEIGTAQDIYTHSKNDYTKNLIKSIPISSPYERQR